MPTPIEKSIGEAFVKLRHLGFITADITGSMLCKLNETPETIIKGIAYGIELMEHPCTHQSERSDNLTAASASLKSSS